MQIRLRMNHTRTQKDGWRLDDDTVEITVTDMDVAHGITTETLATLLDDHKHLLYSEGVRIAQQRNMAEGIGPAR